MAKTFRVMTGSIWVSDIKYYGEDEVPAYIEDGMNLQLGAVDSWAVVHKGEKNEISED